MISFLLALAPLFPAIISIIGLLIKWFGASAKQLKDYADVVQKNKDSGLITVETAERLADYHEQMAKEYAEKMAAHQAIADVVKPPPQP